MSFNSYSLVVSCLVCQDPPVLEVWGGSLQQGDQMFRWLGRKDEWRKPRRLDLFGNAVLIYLFFFWGVWEHHLRCALGRVGLMELGVDIWIAVIFRSNE
jgi:hypothetical protein